jgi:hypothetical protein
LALSACKKDDAKASDPTQVTGATQATGGADASDPTQATGGENQTGDSVNTEPSTPANDPELPTTPNGGSNSGGNIYVENENEMPEEPGVCSHMWGNATCTTGRVCGMCGQIQEGTEALGHNWKDATCEAPKTCRRCNITEGAKLEHTFSGGVCSECGEPDPNPPATNEDELPVL